MGLAYDLWSRDRTVDHSLCAKLYYCISITKGDSCGMGAWEAIRSGAFFDNGRTSMRTIQPLYI